MLYFKVFQKALKRISLKSFKDFQRISLKYLKALKEYLLREYIKTFQTLLKI